MAFAFITGKDGTGDYTIGAQSYKTVLDMFRIREITEMFNVDVFANEGTADQEPGRSQLVGEISGVGAQGAVEAGPLIPAPQSVTFKAIYSGAPTGTCFISGNANFPESNADRLVNQVMRIGSRFLSKKVYTTTWNRM
jgi:hypothetical protein